VAFGSGFILLLALSQGKGFAAFLLACVGPLPFVSGTLGLPTHGDPLSIFDWKTESTPPPTGFAAPQWGIVALARASIRLRLTPAAGRMGLRRRPRGRKGAGQESSRWHRR